LTALWFALLAPSATAVPVDNGVQAQIHPAGLRFLSRELSNSPWSLASSKGPLDLTFECYAMTIDNANLELTFGEVSLTTERNRLVLDAEVQSAVGRDMHVDANATGSGLCVSFEGDVVEMSVRDLRVSGELLPTIIDDTLDVAFLQPLEVDATTSVDFANVPNWVEEAALLILEDALLNYAGNELEAELPNLLASLTIDGFLYQSEFAGFSIGVVPSAVRTTEQGLYASASIDLGGDGGSGELLDLPPRDGSHVAVGITEAMVEEVGAAAWANGLIAPDSETTNALFTDLLDGLGLGRDVQVRLGINTEPRVRITPEGMAIALPATALTVTNPAGQSLVALDADIDGLLELKVERGSLLLTAHELLADVTRLDASALLEDGPDNLEKFLEDWVVKAAAAAIDDLELYQSHFEALDYVLRVDHSAFEPGAVLAWARLFRSDDPAIDRTPPDTSGQVRLEGDTLRATFEGRDDRPGELVYSYRLNGGSWSSWSTETEATLTARPGDNRFEVKARDEWYNEDPTPAGGTVTRAQDEGCGCATPTVPGPLALLLVPLLAIRRAQR